MKWRAVPFATPDLPCRLKLAIGAFFANFTSNLTRNRAVSRARLWNVKSSIGFVPGGKIGYARPKLEFRDAGWCFNEFQWSKFGLEKCIDAHQMQSLQSVNLALHDHNALSLKICMYVLVFHDDDDDDSFRQKQFLKFMYRFVAEE